MPPRKRAAAAPARDVTPDEGVATENVVRDPDDIPTPAAADVAPPLAVENVVIDRGQADVPDEDNSDVDDGGQEAS